ncbi:hypothetical protein Mapa_016024 [Marchantia paleacea]|nr:hypothetical protein Mapa_016024 [Marchantia paleacea]
MILATHIVLQNRMRALGLRLRSLCIPLGNRWMGGRTVVASPRPLQRRTYEQSNYCYLNPDWLESWRIVQRTWIQPHQNSFTFQPLGQQCAQSTIYR